MIENSDIKKSLREKEKISFDSQVKQNKIEMQLTKLEAIKNNIINGKKNILSKIISFIVYDIIMLLIIILFISNIRNNFTLTPLLITTLYIGVLSIGMSGAYLATKIELKIKKYYQNKGLNIILNKIKVKEHEIKLEINKREIIKKEITQIINQLDNTTKDVPILNNDFKNVILKNNKVLARVKRKNKEKH